jgi:hypothetical protein
MSVASLERLLERRFSGAAVHGATSAATSGWRTGISSVDRVLGPAGLPLGRVSELFGDRSSGKTTLAYALLAACTRNGEIGAYVDPEGGLFAPAAAAAGIDLARLIVVRPRQADSLRRAVDALVRSGACGVVVLDGWSVDALQTHHYARLAAQAEHHGTALVVLSRGTSQALASFASLRIHLQGVVALWQPGSDGGDRLSGYRIALTIAKSKIGTPGRSTTFDVRIAETAVSWPAAAAANDATAANLAGEEETGACHASSA